MSNGDNLLRLPGADPGSIGPALWHVRLILSGEQTDTDELVSALTRLSEASPFLGSIRYASDRVVISYWDEAETAEDAAAMALRVWPDNRRCGLPEWNVVGLEVLERELSSQRNETSSRAKLLGDVRPL
jgi:hypothetical protein